MSALSSNTKYYKEAYTLFQQCTKKDDRQDLANKVFEEASSATSDTCKITKSCSREFEQLLPHVTLPTILSSFFDRLTETDLDDFIRDRSACFVLEKLLSYLPNHLSTENQQIHTAYDRLFQCICENFDDYIQETGTSHIIASTISFLHPLINSNDNNEYEQLIDGGRTPKKFFELPADWNVDEKLREIKKLIKKNTNYNEFVYATLLRTCGYLNEKLYIKLVDHICEKHYSEINLEHILDKRSSFIFEVLLEFPSEQRNNILYEIVLNNIDEIYLHSIGNFFLQHLLLTLNEKDLIEKIYLLIMNDDRFTKLVEKGQIRLLITFIRVCERFHCHYEELISRLKLSINCTNPSISEFIPSVLKLRAENPETQLITKDGSLVVQALLRAEKIDSLTRQSFLSLTGEQISIIACHPSGSHLLCQLILKSNLWSILRQKNFYDKLNQEYTKMACDKSACWFVTQLWKSATTIDQKLQMAKSMAKDFQTLRSHTYAKFIAYEMNLTAFCSRPDQWKRSIDTILKKHALFDDLDDDKPKKKKKKKF
ncbi:unnamed protein product [Adineta steineri]|uniref:Pumilio domain-containing protein NOP9 n=1 Tax=Adineta steineri TaxID=433720 RepID=A0A813QAD2_9BILA|nr:unnamed protein product [Adineta steineri]CAF3547326.1 unnamed protein product [Adineta steineri]